MGKQHLWASSLSHRGLHHTGGLTCCKPEAYLEWSPRRTASTVTQSPCLAVPKATPLKNTPPPQPLRVQIRIMAAASGLDTNYNPITQPLEPSPYTQQLQG